MTVLMFRKRYVTPILAGTKRQTIRPARKRPLQDGVVLSLRHWYAKAYRSPQVEFATVLCTGSVPIEIAAHGVRFGLAPWCDNLAALDEFARGDGFGNWKEMKEVFESPLGYGLPFQGVLIRWEPAPVNLTGAEEGA